MTKKKKKPGKKGYALNDKELQERCNMIADMTDAFCNAGLNEDYRELCEDLIGELWSIRFPLLKGKPASWAGAIVHAVGWVNFLHDPQQSPHMSSAEIAEGFGLSQGTVVSKSKLIRDALDIGPLDPDWCTPAMLENNPLVWMMEIDGFAVDIRLSPREVQEEAYRLGLIPYIPADRPEPPSKSDPDTGAIILEFPSNRNKIPDSESPDEPKEDMPSLFDGLE